MLAQDSSLRYCSRVSPPSAGGWRLSARPRFLRNVRAAPSLRWHLARRLFKLLECYVDLFARPRIVAAKPPPTAKVAPATKTSTIAEV